MDTAAAGVIDIQNSKHVEDDLGHSEDTTTEDTVEILQDSRDYKVLDSISEPQNKTDHNSTTDFVDINLIESEMLIVPTATDLARTVTINKTSKHNQSDNDNAELKPSQTQIPSVWDTFSLAETEADDDDDAAETTWEHTSFTTQFDNYDSYSDSYQDPSLFSLSRDESSFVLRPSYNFSGLQVGVCRVCAGLHIPAMWPDAKPRRSALQPPCTQVYWCWRGSKLFYPSVSQGSKYSEFSKISICFFYQWE